jgi:protein subunit release factor A
MAIIKQYHKDTDTTYVYESISYWDAEKGQSRSKRRVIGKIDPETGEMIPTGKRGRTKKDNTSAQAHDAALSPDDPRDDQKRILELEISNAALSSRIAELEAELDKYHSVIGKISALSGKINAACSAVVNE